MLEVIRRYREMRPASVLVIIVALIFGGYNVHRALGFGAHVDPVQVSAASPLASKNASPARIGDPDFTTADRSTLKSVETLTRIEELQVGERIRSDAPTDELDLQFGNDITPSGWRKLTLVAPKRDGSFADVVLLRPLTWLTEQHSRSRLPSGTFAPEQTNSYDDLIGGTVFISVPECGIDGHAKVLAIDPCPPIEPAGDLGGRVITGTFRHQVSESISLSIAGQAEPILCTGNHPFWSDDRHDFVRADSLQPDEKLRTTTGTTTVTSLRHIPGSTPVYNLEIHGTHVYHVGTSGVLVHNGGGLPTLDCDEWVSIYKGIGKDLNPSDLVQNGLGGQFSSAGAFFGLTPDIAAKYARQYRNGAMEFRIPKNVYEDLVRQGKIIPDLNENGAIAILPEAFDAINKSSVWKYFGQYSEDFWKVFGYP